jgi:hypothetical protein
MSITDLTPCRRLLEEAAEAYRLGDTHQACKKAREAKACFEKAGVNIPPELTVLLDNACQGS